MLTTTPLPTCVVLPLSVSELEPVVLWKVPPLRPLKTLCSLCSPRLAATQASVQTALADDFDTPRAINAIMSLVYHGNCQLQAVSKVTH